MKICIGHDYYDCAMAYGVDPSIVLVRKNEKLPPFEAPIPKYPLLTIQGWGQGCGWGLYPASYSFITVVFASKVYRGVEIDGTYFWAADKLRAWIAEHKDNEVTVHSLDQDYTRKSPPPVPLEEYFAVTESPQNLKDYMISNRYATLLAERGRGYLTTPTVTMNPYNLKRLDFAKALDPYTAYQELSMWVGGVLAGESPQTVKIVSDKVLIEGHGFDNKISFRGPRI